VLGFLKSLFQPQSSSEAAKERLRVVLLSDHLCLAPEVVELLKADLLAVMSKYVEIDERNAEVTFEQRESDFALSASVPILSVKTERTAAYRATIAVGTLQEQDCEDPAPSVPSSPGRRRRRRRNRRLAQIQVASTTIVQASQVQATAQAQAEPLQV
jgi:cell division topological specificity factor